MVGRRVLVPEVRFDPSLRSLLPVPKSGASLARGVDQVRADRDVEAANCPASLLDDAHTAREVGLVLLRLDGDVPQR